MYISNPALVKKLQNGLPLTPYDRRLVEEVLC